MSKPAGKVGKFVKKHPLEAAALAGTAALGGPAVLGAGGLLGGGTAAGGLASVYGPSALTAALAGDAFMPAALGATGEGTAPVGSLLGSKLANASGKTALRGVVAANKMGLLGGQPQQAPSGMPPSTAQAPITNTVLFPKVGAPTAPKGMPPIEVLRDPRLYEQWLAQQMEYL